MKPLDLSLRPPRSPRERLDGLSMLPRTIDKARASLPGGNLNGYRILGMSARMLEWLGVEEDAFLNAVADAETDDDVARWLRTQTDAAKYPEVSSRLEQRTIADVDIERFRKIYPWAEGTDVTILYDILDEDDRRMYASKP